MKNLIPGLMIVAIISLAARFISDHYGAPAMLMALLFGMAMHFVVEEPRPRQGIDFASKKVLRFGVALLGLNISTEMALSLGVGTLLIVILAVIATIIFGMVVARWFGFEARFAFLSSGSVAICGASAAMAISAILPKDDRSEERLVFTVVGVTILSTIAMIAYPILADRLGMSSAVAGVFLGATIHDVAQVVGAGFSMSGETGEIATIIKLVRVAMLAPVIMVAVIIIRRNWKEGETTGDERPPLLPFFVIGFFALFAANSLGWVPDIVSSIARELARWALLAAIAAVGVKTSLKDVYDVGAPAIGLLVTETLFIGLFVLAALRWVGN
ncbi:MAG: putative sulfate exporter family transporter [Gammaproteobacteria bacterium]|nr:MAG: putative sulfate exporter family transporter [Gammaproteobacteria bacterium]